MPSAERTIAIRRPVDQVDRFLSDPRTSTQWRLGPLDADYEVTARERGRRIAFRNAGSLHALGEFELEAMGDATILTYRLAAALPWWRRLLVGGRVQAVLEAELRNLDELQDLLER